PRHEHLEMQTRFDRMPHVARKIVASPEYQRCRGATERAGVLGAPQLSLPAATRSSRGLIATGDPEAAPCGQPAAEVNPVFRSSASAVHQALVASAKPSSAETGASPAAEARGRDRSPPR